MALKVTKTDVWVAQMQDEPGGLAGVLEALADAAASLQCVIARRQPDKPGSGVAFLTPIKGRKAMDAAKAAGAKPAGNIATLRVDGPDKKGIGAAMARAMADAGVNVRGVSAATIGNKFVAYIGLDSPADADRAAKALKAMDKPAKKGRK